MAQIILRNRHLLTEDRGVVIAVLLDIDKAEFFRVGSRSSNRVLSRLQCPLDLTCLDGHDIERLILAARLYASHHTL